MSDGDLPVAVCFLSVRAGLVLGVSRKDDQEAFGLPGGKVDPSDERGDFYETCRAAMARELWEETGVQLSAGDFEVVYEGVCAGDVSYRQVVMTHPAEGWEATTQAGEGRVGWVGWERLEAGPFGEFNRRLRGAVWWMRYGVLNPGVAPHG